MMTTEERIAAEMAQQQNFKAKPVDKRVIFSLFVDIQ
jgi:hypothetical protein